MSAANDLRALASRVPNPELSARLEADARRTERREALEDVLGAAIGAALLTFATIAAFLL